MRSDSFININNIMLLSRTSLTTEAAGELACEKRMKHNTK